MSRGRGGHSKEYQQFPLPSHQSKSSQGFFSQTFPANPRTPYVPNLNASLGRFPHPPPYSSIGPPGAFPSGCSANPFTSSFPGPPQLQSRSSSSNRGAGEDEAAEFRQRQILFLRGQSDKAPKFVPLHSEHHSGPPQHRKGFYNSPKPNSYVSRGGYIRGRPSWEKGFTNRYHSGPKSGWEQDHFRSPNNQNQCDSREDRNASRLSSSFYALSLENFDEVSSSGSSRCKAPCSHPSDRFSLHLTPDIQKQVLSSLASLQEGEAIQAKVLGKRLRLPKKVVNKALYSLSKLSQAVRIEGFPPLWRLYKEGETESSNGRTQFRVKTDKCLNQNQDLSKELKPGSDLTSAISAATEARSDSSEESEDSEKDSSSKVPDSDQPVNTFSSTEKEAGPSATMEAKDNKEQILQYLHETGQASALMIAKNLGLRYAKQVNSALYAMEKHGDLRRSNSGSTAPNWELSAHQREKMQRQRKAAIAAFITHGESELCATPGPVKAVQATPKMVCESGLLEEVMTWENLPTSDRCDSKDGMFGNGILEKQSPADLNSIEEMTSDDNDLTSVPYPSQDALYYQRANKNGAHLEWASDDIPEFLNTIRSEVAVSLAAPHSSAQNMETNRLQRLRLALSKNPVSGLMEYAQFLGYSCEFLLLEQSGPSHNPRLARKFIFPMLSIRSFMLVSKPSDP